jgi:predicted nuclease of predicted toxin-antitoxin system
VAKFLLDANLSPRVARMLAEQFQLDVTSLQGLQLGSLPDHEVIKLARQQGRVIITLDKDYSDYILDAPRQPIAIIHLDIPSRLRNIPAINRLLADFFSFHAATIDLEHVLVIIQEEGIVIHHGS